MVPYNIIITSLDGGQAASAEMKRRLADGWRSPSPLNIVATGSSDPAEEDLKRIDAFVIMACEEVDSSRMLPLLATLEEAGVAALVLVEGQPEADNPYEYAGALTESIECEDAILCATLQGMLHRQQEIIRLRKEASLADRFRGGLQGEVARMHEELQLAAMVQREFLPRELPNLYGINLAALWRPAHYVSGDIYDIARLDNDHIGVFIADAVGHGVPAALMTMIICRSLTTKTIKGNSYELIEPSDVLANLNRGMIRRQGRTTRFATAAYAVINCRTRVMRFAGAGHPPPLLLSANGACRCLETEGGLLGVFEDETYSQIEVDLAVGECMLLYSDGFEQAFPETAADAYKRRLPNMRYRDEFERLIDEPTAQDMVETISHRLDDQAGSLHQIDDLTLLCMQTGPLVIPSDEPEKASAEAASR